VLAALWEAGRSGRGQVVDAAMADGVALLMAIFHGLRAEGLWREDAPGENLLDTGAPFYDVYATADGGWMAVGALEPRFYGELLAGLGLAGAELPDQYDVAAWPVLRARLAGAFATRTRAEWTAVFESTDACVAPVLSMSEAAAHPHLVARGTFGSPGGVEQPMPAPRFARTPAPVPEPTGATDAEERLRGWGFAAGELSDLRASGALGNG
jgi:alpha-methylacyl-CoA racemase